MKNQQTPSTFERTKQKFQFFLKFYDRIGALICVHQLLCFLKKKDSNILFIPYVGFGLFVIFMGKIRWWL